jgi:glycosyltransferase involved in cell wall biosynthesis
LRVLHVITTLDRGGAETQLLELVSQQIRLGNEVTLAYLKGSGTLVGDFVELGATVIARLDNLRFSRQIVRLRLILNQGNKYDVVHCHLPRSEIMVRVAASKDSTIIVSRHNAEPFWPKGPLFVSRLLSRFVIKKAKGVICISEAVKNFLIESCEIKPVDFVKLKVIHYGYRTRTKRILNSSINIPPINLITVSRLVPQKDLDTMLRGFKLYSEILSNATLTIVGKGPLKDKIINRICELELKDRVVILDEVADVPSFLEEFDVFILSSQYEGFGLVLLEAMQAQIPLVVSGSAAAIEVLGESYPGFFPIGDPNGILKLLLQLGERHVFKTFEGYSNLRIKLFDPSIMARKIQATYLGD